MSRLALAAALSGWVSLAAGCSSVWIRPDASPSAPRSLAVLPFSPSQELREEYAGNALFLAHLELRAEQLRTAVAERFALLPYLQLSPAQVERRLLDAGLNEIDRDQGVPAEALRAALGVDLVVRGVLSEDLHVPVGIIYWRSVACRLEVVDLRRGGQLFATLERLEADLGGLLMEMGQPLEGLEDTIDSHSESAFLRLADQLAGQLAREFPRPAVSPELEPPRLDSVRWRLDQRPWSREVRALPAASPPPSEQTLGPGATLQFELRGAPGMRASFRLSGGRALPLTEVSQGHYVGHYRVSPGEVCSGPRLLLSDAFGAAETRELPLRVDARRPPPPQGLAAEHQGARVALSWEEPRSSLEIRCYLVYVRTRAGGLQEILRAQECAASVPSSEQGCEYLVAALSIHGALGESAAVLLPGSALTAPAGGPR